MRLKPHRPSREILSGESADVCFARATRILEREGLDPDRIRYFRLKRVDLAAWWSPV